MASAERARRAFMLLVAAACLAAFAFHFTAPTRGEASPGAPPADAPGRALYVDHCSSCHGFELAGVAGMGPDLRGVGAGAVDFQLSTGRMPLAGPGDQSKRKPPAFSPAEIDELAGYVGSFGGPGVPAVDPDAGELGEGMHAFTSHCAGCHTITGEGGVVGAGIAPELKEATPIQVAEAIRSGPGAMPDWDEREIPPGEVDSIAAYVERVVQEPDDRGGWGIGHIGPVPEGMIAWLLAGVAVLLVARVIGEGLSGRRGGGPAGEEGAR